MTTEERLRERKRYIPKGAIHIRVKDAPIDIYLSQRESTANGKTCQRFIGVVFMRTAGKPVINSWFRSAEAREAYISQHVKSVIQSAREKAERKEQAKAAPCDWQVGTILDGSWGYDQTNREFWQVVAIKGRMVQVRPLAQETTRAIGFMSEYVRPIPDKFSGEALTKRLQTYDGKSFYVSFDHFSLSPWDGREKLETSYA